MMEIDTTLTVPTFNIIKYVLVFLLLDTVIRKSLAELRSFLRGLKLSRGQSLPLGRSNIDRHGLLSSLFRGKSCSTVFVIVVTLTAYAVELSLEFSTRTKVHHVVSAGEMNVFEANQTSCSLKEVKQHQVGKKLKKVADECVALTDDKYILYSPVWVGRNEDFTPFCLHTPKNIMASGPLLYRNYPYPEGSVGWSELQGFKNILRSESNETTGESSTSFIRITTDSKDIVSFRRYYNIRKSRVSHYSSAIVAKKMANGTVECFGDTYGRHGEGQMKVQVFGCVQQTSQGKVHLAFLTGTGAVFTDARHMKSLPWKGVILAEENGMLYDFARELVLQNSSSRQSVMAAAMFMALVRRSGVGIETETVNRYAVAYKHCARLKVPPQVYHVARKRIVEHASLSTVIYVTASLWAVVLIFVWPLIMGILAVILRVHSNSMELTNAVKGEGDLARRWLLEKREFLEANTQEDEYGSELNSEIQGSTQRKCATAFLSVQLGRTHDQITVTSSSRNIKRDCSKPFQEPIILRKYY